jgi:hypothetical protein
VDGLIIYSLEGTDPDKGILLDRQQITAAIADDVPTATTFVEAALDRRLQYLSSKARPEGRAIRWHQKEDEFCLPYDTRRVIESENLEDEELRIAVLDSLRSRIAAAGPGMDDSLQLAADLALRAIQLT